MRRTNKQLNHQSSISRVMKQVVEPHHQWLNQTTNVSSPATPAPPNTLPAAYNEAHALTQQLHKMASLNSLPLVNSQGLERLLFRLVRVNETMAVIFNEILERGLVASAHPVGWQGEQPDEGYQTSYCDDCGGELTPAGTCVNRACTEFGG